MDDFLKISFEPVQGVASNHWPPRGLLLSVAGGGWCECTTSRRYLQMNDATGAEGGFLVEVFGRLCLVGGEAAGTPPPRRRHRSGEERRASGARWSKRSACPMTSSTTCWSCVATRRTRGPSSGCRTSLPPTAAPMSPWLSFRTSSILKNATSRPCRHTPTWYVRSALMSEHRSSPERGDDEGECASGSVTELCVLVPSCHAGVRGSVDTGSRGTGQANTREGAPGVATVEAAS